MTIKESTKGRSHAIIAITRDHGVLHSPSLSFMSSATKVFGLALVFWFGVSINLWQFWHFWQFSVSSVFGWFWVCRGTRIASG